MRMRGGVLIDGAPAMREIYGLGRRCTRKRKRQIRVQSSFEDRSSAERREIELEQLAALVQSHTPLRKLVRWVAGVRASVHTKLLAAFLVVTLLFITMAAIAFQTFWLRTSRRNRPNQHNNQSAGAR